MDVNLATVNETHMKGNDKLKIEGFKTFSRNRQDAAMGGVCTIVKNDKAGEVLKVSEGKDDEYIITRHGEYEPALNIINYYGKQESRQVKDNIDKDWENLLDEIIKIESKGENVIIASDMNRHVGKFIPGNHDKNMYAGKLLIGFLNKGDYILLNSSPLEINGPFTRYETNDSNNADKVSSKFCLLFQNL